MGSVRLALPLLTAVLLATPRGTAAQTVKGQSLAGNWLRIDSNNDPLDLMRITIGPGGAVLTSVPTAAGGAFKVGQVLWRQIQPNGTLQIRGSDGNYYPSTLVFTTPDEVHIRIQHTGAGYDQTWQRAGPSVDGQWHRIAPVGTPEVGTQVLAQGPQGSIRYLPASAPRPYRVGRQLWRSIGPGGALQALGGDGRYYAAQLTLIGTDSLRIDSGSPQVGNGQIWVRPGIVAAALAAQAAGSGKGGPAAPSACVATSIPHDQTGTPWGWGLVSATDNDSREETLGIRQRMIPDFTGAAGNGPVDIERSRLPGFADGFSFLWQPMSGAWEEHRDLTAAQYDQREQAARAAGLRALDIEVYDTPAGMRYAGIWVENTEGLGWQVYHDLTGSAYGQVFQSKQGYRLVDMEAYSTPNGTRYAAIWYQSCDNSNWKQLRDMSRAVYQAHVDSLSDLGYQVVDFESYQTAGGQRYAAIWERIPAGRAWAVRTDRDLNWFLNYHRQYTDEGLRLIDFESYQTANGVRYAGVWAENDRRYRFALKRALDDSIEAYRSAHGIPGISVVVMQDDSVIYRRGFGWADSAQQKAAHSGTVYLTASVAKVIGATIAARLEGRGVIDLSDTTSSLLPYLPSYHTHTVEQLLAKAGCIGHYPEATEPDTTRTYALRRPALSQMWPDRMLPRCTPGTRYHYSTHGYTYVGAALEQVTGDPIARIVDDELTTPFGLSTIRTAVSGTWGGFGSLGVRPYDLARGYVWQSAGSQAANYENTTWKRLGGGLQTDALDLARFGRLTALNAIADTTRLWTPIVTGATPQWDTTNTNTSPTVGLAWVLGTANARLVNNRIVGRRIAEHGGLGRGARSHLRIYRDDGLVVAVLTNQGETKLTSSALNLTAGDPHPIDLLVTTIAGVVFANPPPP